MRVKAMESKSLASSVCASVVGLIVAAAMTGPATGNEADWPAWAQEEEAIRARIAAVNEGELAFLETLPDKPVHQHRNRIVVTDASLEHGWVELEQCHRDLDRVAEAQIVFHPERSRRLQVLGFRNMRSAVTDGNTVQLRGIGDASEVCLRGETRALVEIGEGVYELQNGPYMRRFLDGYYPMRVSLEIEYPRWLTLADFTPERQPGFEVASAPGRVAAVAQFEGRLRTRFRFIAD